VRIRLLSPWPAVWIGLVGLVCAAGAGLWVWQWQRGEAKLLAREWRIGCEPSPPWQLGSPGGPIHGPAIDILSEAARRRRIVLRWVPMTTGPDAALGTGAVDLWPLTGRRPQREGRLYVTAPYMRNSFRLVSREAKPVTDIASMPGRTVATPLGKLFEFLMGPAGRQVRPLVVPSPLEAIRVLCAGNADAALIPQDVFAPRDLDGLPECQGVRFRAISPTDWSADFGVGASLKVPGAPRIADLLREELVQMADDGTLYGLMLNGRVLGSETRLLHDFETLRRSQLFLRLLSAGLLILFVALLWYESRLRRARKAAEAAARMKIEFLANMSHEIRTPMNGILGLTSLVMASDIDSRHRDSLQTIHSSASALLRILDDVLDLAKLEAGKYGLRPAPFRIRRVLSEAVRLFRPRAEEKGIRLDLELLRGIPEWLEGDATRTGQILQNLVGNALKFTETGSVVVRASWGGGEAAGTLLIEVTDTGPGIAPEEIKTLFRKFTQVQPRATAKQRGTGLGLAISKQLVELMGGTIGVRSTLGLGSTFWFALPLKLAPPQEEAEPLPGEARRKSSGVAPKVLVAEDNAVNRMVACRLLERLGCEVTAVRDGKEAVDSALSMAFDLIFLDYQMPKLDGPGAARQIRDAGRSVPMIALTARVMEDDRARCIEAGMADFVTKPVDLDTLARVLDKWLAHSWGAEENPAVGHPAGEKSHAN
jgi:signal transduction histidine kinase/ActR/RegA family two-component response regulator